MKLHKKYKSEPEEEAEDVDEQKKKLANFIVLYALSLYTSIKQNENNDLMRLCIAVLFGLWSVGSNSDKRNAKLETGKIL